MISRIQDWPIHFYCGGNGGVDADDNDKADDGTVLHHDEASGITIVYREDHAPIEITYYREVNPKCR